MQRSISCQVNFPQRHAEINTISCFTRLPAAFAAWARLWKSPEQRGNNPYDSGTDPTTIHTVQPLASHSKSCFRAAYAWCSIQKPPIPAAHKAAVHLTSIRSWINHNTRKKKYYTYNSCFCSNTRAFWQKKYPLYNFAILCIKIFFTYGAFNNQFRRKNLTSIMHNSRALLLQTV